MAALVCFADAHRIIDAFFIEDATGEYYDLGQKPLLRAPFSLGKGLAMSNGEYVIGENCIRCGTCADGCPMACIEAGDPYRIDQECCLRCGTCVEVCPVEAIVAR